ncbi:unnamed protein product [Colias eurytheme]|nr:unnamed protein product [Colias eurytheme]
MAANKARETSAWRIFLELSCRRPAPEQRILWNCLFAKADHPSQFALIDISNTTDQPSCSGYPHPQDAKDLELASALE